MRYFALLLVLAGTAAAQTQVPQIVGAAVESVPPFSTDLSRRQVRFRIRLSAPPACGTAAAPAEYGFLIDSDKSVATGATDAAFAGLGIDARVRARCDDRTSQFVSSIGRVTPLTGADGPGLELVTTVGQLPSVDFFWVPYAAVGNQLALLTDEPRHSRWAIIERLLP